MKKNMKKKSKRISEKGSQEFEEMKTSLVIPSTTKSRKKHLVHHQCHFTSAEAIEHQSLRRAYEVFPKGPDKNR